VEKRRVGNDRHPNAITRFHRNILYPGERNPRRDARTVWLKRTDRMWRPCKAHLAVMWEKFVLTDQGIIIRCVLEKDIFEMSQLLGDVFSRRDPPAIATRFSVDKLEKIAAIFGAKSAREGLSSVAVDTRSGDIVGAILAHDFGLAPPSEIENIDISSEPVIALLDELETTFSNTHDIKAGEFLHIFMIAVRDEHSGKGIAQNLVEGCLQQADAAGYGVAFTEATN
jgi:predicted N-acetyltransferase YhbS